MGVFFKSRGLQDVTARCIGVQPAVIRCGICLPVFVMVVVVVVVMIVIIIIIIIRHE
jgi:hypothetical protein